MESLEPLTGLRDHLQCDRGPMQALVCRKTMHFVQKTRFDLKLPSPFDYIGNISSLSIIEFPDLHFSNLFCLFHFDSEAF